MRRQIMSFALIALFTSIPLCQRSGQSLAAEQARGARPDLKEVEKRIIEATNEFRSKENRRELSVSPELSRAARYFADFMAQTDKYGHTADGKQPGERAKEHGYQYCLIGENIAYFFNPAGFST